MTPAVEVVIAQPFVQVFVTAMRQIDPLTFDQRARSRPSRALAKPSGTQGPRGFGRPGEIDSKAALALSALTPASPGADMVVTCQEA